MKKIIFVFVLATLLTVGLGGSTFVDYAIANPYTQLHLPKITINSDGSVNPETQYLTILGGTYTLTGDIIQKYSIEILCSNILFDGAGHTIDVAVSGSFSDDEYPAYYMDVGINLMHVNNVVIKNVKVLSNNNNAVNLQYSSNCQIIGVTINKSVRILGDFNSVTECKTGVAVLGSNNLIIQNNITSVFVGGNCYSNKFLQNNFYLTDYPDLLTESLWDNDLVGNYWNNYTIKYPDAREVGSSEIGDTPYVIERGLYSTTEYPNQKNIDHYPLMYPWGAPVISIFSMVNATYSGSFYLNFTVNKPAVWLRYSLDKQSNTTITENITIADLPGGLHNITVYAKDKDGNIGASETVYFNITNPFPIELLAVISVTSITIVGIGMLVYFTKRKR